MTQKEFEERTGLSVSAEHFAEIHKVYMEAGDYVDKDTFCKEWKKNQQSGIVEGMHNTIRVLNVSLSVAVERNKEYEAQLVELVDFLLERAQKFGDVELLHKSVELMGYPYVIRRKFEKELSLWKEDRQFVIEAMKLM